MKLLFLGSWEEVVIVGDVLAVASPALEGGRLDCGVPRLISNDVFADGWGWSSKCLPPVGFIGDVGPGVGWG